MYNWMLDLRRGIVLFTGWIFGQGIGRRMIEIGK